jgi:hypothetical protein
MSSNSDNERRRKELEGSEYPFTLEMVGLPSLFMDERYQRPVDESWVQKNIVDQYDPGQIGALDVSARASGEYAVLDGGRRWTGLSIIGTKTAPCCVHYGMSVADEARFFYKKNKDRQNVHPYYQIRARIVMGERKARRINKIVSECGYRLYIASSTENDIPAIGAVERAFEMSSIAREESLTPTLTTMRRCFLGRDKGTDGQIIRGLSRFFQNYYDDEIDLDTLDKLLTEIGPSLLIGRAQDQLASGRGGGSHAAAIARILLDLYNRSGAKKLYRPHFDGRKE